MLHYLNATNKILSWPVAKQLVPEQQACNQLPGSAEAGVAGVGVAGLRLVLLQSRQCCGGCWQPEAYF